MLSWWARPLFQRLDTRVLTYRTTRVLAAAILFRCNSGGDVISRVEFNGSADVSSYDLTGQMMATGTLLARACRRCRGRRSTSLSQRSTATATVLCDDTNGCNKDEYALVAGTDTQSLGSCVQYRVHSRRYVSTFTLLMTWTATTPRASTAPCK